jgi:hypothetical protein
VRGEENGKGRREVDEPGHHNADLGKMTILQMEKRAENVAAAEALDCGHESSNLPVPPSPLLFYSFFVALGTGPAVPATFMDSHACIKLCCAVAS